MPKHKPNRYERHQNKRALERKQRSKEKHVRVDAQEQSELAWASIAPDDFGQDRVGIVAQTSGDGIVVVNGQDRILCQLSSEVPSALGRTLVIGDRVLLDVSGDGGVILARLPRRSSISRLRGDRQRISVYSYQEHVVAANVDIAAIVAAAIDPPFHPRFVDRYLVICQNGGVEPVICLNKCDLTEDRSPVLALYRGLGLSVIETSAVTGEGLEELRRSLQSKIAVLVGHSGVGKSSLVNALVPGLAIGTNVVSPKTGRGQHTTSSSQMYLWAPHSYIIDTPGIRSLGLSHLDKRQLRLGFPEFAAYAEQCRYRDCLHYREPHCAVKSAVLAGRIDAARYDSYTRMLEE